MHYTCIACITIDSVMRMKKKNHPQVYLEKCKYKSFESESESELESDAELELRSDSEFDTE